jgi:nitrogen fixation NifU-like protein
LCGPRAPIKEQASVYSEKVMDHFRNPRNVGEIEDADGVGKVGNPVCGDIMELTIKVDDGVITDAMFRTFGCGAAIATSSIVTELVKGKTIEEALEISNKAVVEALGGLPPVKMHCSVLAEQALKSAIQDFKERSGEPSEAGEPAAAQPAADE